MAVDGQGAPIDGVVAANPVTLNPVTVVLDATLGDGAQ